MVSARTESNDFIPYIPFGQLSLAPIEQLLLYLSGRVSVALGHESQQIGMAWSAVFAPADKILAFKFPANLIDREAIRRLSPCDNKSQLLLR